MTLEERFAQERQSVEAFEQTYQLPPLLGSERQRVWARLIRYDFLRQILGGGIIDATRPCSAQQAQQVHAVVGRLRADQRAFRWIDTYRHRLGQTVQYVLSVPAADEIGQEMTAEHARKSQESRKLTKEAAAFEKLHRLPVAKDAKELRMERSNADAAALDFFGFMPQRRDWILKQSPGPSVLVLQRDGKGLKGTWTGMSLKMREEHYKEGTKDKVRQVPDRLEYPTVQVTFKRQP